MKYIAKLIKEEGGFSVVVPVLQGGVSEGETREEALQNIEEAIRLHVEGLKEKGWPIPQEDSEIVEINF